jgi:hypothetical protein
MMKLSMRRSRIFLLFLFVESLLLAGLLTNLRPHRRSATVELENARRQIVSRLSLTDLSLWTESRYTRHPSQADLFSAFQDSPSALDCFPAASLVPPVGWLQKIKEEDSF